MVPSAGTITTPSQFGSYTNSPNNFPSDVVQLDIYNDQQYYFESIPSATEYSLDNNRAYVDVEKELVKQNYIAGDFEVNVRFIRNYLGSALGEKLIIQEISRDRLEIRVLPTTLENTPEGAINLSSFFSSPFFSLEKQSVLVSLYAFFTPTEQYGIVDYVQDKFTFPTAPHSIVFKLSEPLPLAKSVGDYLWIAQEVDAPTTEKVLIIPPPDYGDTVFIAGPNFDAVNKQGLGVSTEYQNWDELLSSNSRQLTRTVNSSSLVEGINLNIDYRDFDNFIKFGSAYERVKNFEYKVRLIENYYGISSSLAATNTSGSYYTQTQITSTLDKIDNIVGAFDGFERFMYFESSSYTSSSLGEYFDRTWPKSTTTKPYTLYPANSVTAQNWLQATLASASLFDDNNQSALRRLVPNHIQEDENAVVDSFIDLLGHYFDTQYQYVKQIPDTFDRQQKLTEGYAKDLVYAVAQNLGVDFSNGQNFQNLWSYMLGLNSSGSYDNALQLSGEDRTREVWKRIINNLPYLLKTKGTERGVRALLNCYGIPSTIMRIREFGGPEIDFDKQSTFNHDRFYYALGIGSGSSYGRISWFGQSNVATYTGPKSFELRFKSDNVVTGSAAVYRLAHTTYPAAPTLPNYYQFNIGRDNAGDYVQMLISGSAYSAKAYLSSSSSTKLFGGNWVNVLVEYSGYADFVTYQTTSSYNLYIGQKANYSETPIIASASISWQTASLQDIFRDKYGWYGAHYLEIGTGSVYANQPTSSFSGSLQEIRLWGGVVEGTQSAAMGLCATGGLNLQQSPFYAHIISPTTIVGSNYGDPSWTGSTGSFTDLSFRLTLGSDNKRINLSATSSLSGSQPNFAYSNRTGSFVNFNTNTASYWAPIVETNYMPWPDMAGNRQASNKIRIESTINTSTDLYRNTKTQTSLLDSQPTDSPRLGVYLSPTDQINEDIAEQFGGLSIDDYIGNYSDLYENHYADLDDLNREYFKKYTSKNNPQAFIRLLQYFDASFFAMIKQIVPYRANLQTGLVIEPHILDRSKVKLAGLPTLEDLTHETLIELPSTAAPSGSMLDIDPGIIEAGVATTISGSDIPVYEGQLNGSYMVGVTAPWDIASPFATNSLLYRSGSIPGSYEEDTLRGNITSYGRDKIEGSQYNFYSWYLTGSTPYTGITTNPAGFAYLNSVGDDYSNPIALEAITAKPSEVFNPGEVPYSVNDILKGTGSFDKDPTDTVYTGSYFNTALGSLGFRFTTEVTGSSTTTRWSQVSVGTGPLRFTTPTNTIATSSFTVPVFFYENYPNTIYEVSFNTKYTASPGAPTNPTLYFKFGSVSSSYGQDITLTTTQTSYTIYTKADGPYLAVLLNTSQSSTTNALMELDSLRIVPYIRTEIQDYQVGPLASIGQRNQKYDGCKLIATDWNVDSSDTIDRGPVVTIIEGPGVDITVDPIGEGTFTFR